VQIFENSTVWEVTSEGGHIIYRGDLIFIRADTIILAVGAKSERKLYEEIRGIIREVYAVGDCVEPRGAWDAIHEATNLAYQI